MAEYIDKHDAYTLLKDLEAAYIYPPVREAYGKAARRIDQMKAADVQPVDRWIKADESLPVYGGMVLICDKSKNIRLGIYTDMGWCSQFGNPMMCKITHWQPLPEPPKDGDAE